MANGTQEIPQSRPDDQVRPLDLDQFAKIAWIGVNRAYVFMGIGTNVARDTQWDKYQLPELASIQIVPPQVSPDTLLEFKSEFGKWVATNGLRELLETFGVYLDRLYPFILSVETWANARKNAIESSPDELKKKVNTFVSKALPGKIQILRTDFEITCDFADDIVSLHQARNCLVHGAGVVRCKDVNDVDGMTVSWRIHELYGYEADGTEVTARSADLPKAFPENSAVYHRFASIKKTTCIGDEFILEPNDLAEICAMISVAIHEYQLSVARYAHQCGATVNYRNQDGSSGPLPSLGYSVTAMPIDGSDAKE